MQRKSGVMLAIALTACCATAGAQMIVHAVSGTVKTINAAAKTIDVTVDSGDTSEFKVEPNAKVTLDFDNTLRSDATAASKFQKVGDFVVVYYYGYDENRTAVAIKDLGAGPFQKIEGTVMNFDKHSRTMTVKDEAGKTESFVLGPHLVVDLGISVQNGRSYDPHKGYSVRVTYKTDGGKNTAVFVRSRE